MTCLSINIEAISVSRMPKKRFRLVIKNVCRIWPELLGLNPLSLVFHFSSFHVFTFVTGWEQNNIP